MEALGDPRETVTSPAVTKRNGDRTRTKLRPPPLSIELLFRPSGLFELAIDVDEDVTDGAHGCASTKHGTCDA